MGSKSPLYSQVEPFSRPSDRRAVMELLQTIVPFLVLSLGMMFLAARGLWWVALPLAVAAAAFLVRTFIVFHDCCHGSFFRSRRTNRWVGYLTGLLTLTPFERWQRSHAEHHATVGDLDRRGEGDVWTLTVAEFRAASPARRFHYRVFRNPFVMLGIGPALLFVIGNRWPPRDAGRREQFSVHFTNAGILGTLAVAHFTIGLPVFLLTQLPTFIIAATAGVWLFYVQHQYEDAYWARRPEWEPMKAALEGSSYYKLPRVLQWFTGSIGLHHVHHVQPRIPFYNLQRCQDSIPVLRQVPPLTLRGSLRSLRLRLVDEERHRMVTWSEVKAGS